MLNLKKEFYYGNNSQFLEKIKIWWRHGIDWFIILLRGTHSGKNDVRIPTLEKNNRLSSSYVGFWINREKVNFVLFRHNKRCLLEKIIALWAEGHVQTLI